MSISHVAMRDNGAAVLSYTWFQRNTAAIGQRGAIAWLDLCRWIEKSAPTAPTKEALPLIKLATFANDHRSNGTIEAVHGIEGDYDAGTAQPADAAERLRAAGIEALIYTTPSHRADAPRWRVLCPLSAAMPADQRHALVARLNGALGGILARESFTPAQPFYVGTVDGGEPMQCIRVSGAPLDTVTGIVPAGLPPGSGGQRAGMERAPSYDLALEALRSRDPADMERPEWLLLSGAFYTATAGLVDAAVALVDWQAWNGDYPGNDPAANGRTWAGFERSGTAGDWRTLADMSDCPNAKGWRWFKGETHPRPPAAQAAARRQIDASNFFVHVRDMQVRPPDFLIDHLLETDAMAVLFGDPASGKSFIALDIAACVATGCDFHGHCVKTGPVFYIAGEGHNGLRRRLEAWEELRGRPLSDCAFHVSRRSAQFLDRECAAMVRLAVEGLARDHGAPRLIVIDTLARNFGPGDENSTADMTRFVAALDTLRSDYPESSVLIVHHSGHGDKDRGRGSSVLWGGVDTEYKVAKSGDTITLSSHKMKDAPPPRPMTFNLVEAGQSVALEYAGEGAASGGLSHLARLALEAMGGDPVTADEWRARFYAARPDCKPDTNRKAFKSAVDKLLTARLIIMDGQNYRHAPMLGMPPPR